MVPSEGMMIALACLAFWSRHAVHAAQPNRDSYLPLHELSSRANGRISSSISSSGRIAIRNNDASKGTSLLERGGSLADLESDTSRPLHAWSHSRPALMRSDELGPKLWERSFGAPHEAKPVNLAGLRRFGAPILAASVDVKRRAELQLFNMVHDHLGDRSEKHQIADSIGQQADDELLFSFKEERKPRRQLLRDEAVLHRPDYTDLSVNLTDALFDDFLIARGCDWQIGLRNRDDSQLGFPENVADGQVVCIHGDDHNLPGFPDEAMSEFFTFTLPKLTASIKLMSVQSDHPTPPARFRKHLDDSRIIGWYGWNLADPPHRKLQPVPIGLSLNRHWNPLKEALLHLKNRPVPWAFKSDKVLVNFGTGTSRSSKERQALLNMSLSWPFADRVATPKNKDANANYLDTIAKYKFIVCPSGDGQDTHRTWEALYFGMVPIVLKSSLDREYENLPIILLDKWDDLPLRWEEVRRQPEPPPVRDLEKLSMTYWIKTIRDKASGDL